MTKITSTAKANRSVLNFRYKPQPGIISVIIPVYKDVKGLKDTLHSLKNQELPDNKFEIIIANDGGDEAVTKLCKKNSLAMIEIIPNKGSYFARNRAIENTRGEYLAFVDADVKISPGGLANGILQLQQADYAAGDVQIDHSAVRSKAHYFDLKTSFPMQMYMEKHHFGGAGNLFVKRKVFTELGGFDEQLKSGGDNEFGSRVYLSGKFTQVFSKQIVGLHPPRSFWEQVNKKSRITLGMIVLSQLYPDRYPKKDYQSPGIWIKSFLPCSRQTINKAAKKILSPSYVYYFFYCWLLKIFSSLKQVLDYRSLQRNLKASITPEVRYYKFEKK